MSEIRLNKAAYIHNLTKICDKAGGKEKVIVVLKDNAYGHGVRLIASEAKKFGIKNCAVKSEFEANEIADIFENILILSHIPTGDESAKFTYAINDIDALLKIKENTKINLAIDTGMHRNGLDVSELDYAFEILARRNLELLGAYTHFRASDELNADYFVQRENFNAAKAKILALCDEFGIKKPIFHSHNSAALERASAVKDEMVRVGIAQYGYAQFNGSLNLKPVLSLWAKRVSRRVLKSGQSVGYGAKFIAKDDINVATYDLGYGDGLLRYNGLGELRLANGEMVLGKISMDSLAVKIVASGSVSLRMQMSGLTFLAR